MSIINENEINVKDYEQQIDNLSKLLGINSIINSTLEIDRLLTLIMEKIQDIMESEASTLFLYEEGTGDLVFKVALGKAGEKLQKKYTVKLGQGIAGWVAENLEPLYINDVYQDERFDPNFDKKTGFTTKSILCAPLMFKGRFLGVIQAINSLHDNGFSDDNLELFKAFSNQAAIAIENASLYANLESKVEERTAELADAYEKLKELDKTKTIFFTNISHELRTPLTLILSPVESILKGDYGTEIKCDDPLFQSMHNNSIRLLTQINTLLDFSKIESGSMRVKRQRSDISQLIKYYNTTIKSAAQSRDLNISFNDKTDGTIAWIDQDLIEKAVFNLISNALKFTKPGGNIKVELDAKDDSFIISVSDTGIGIEKDMIDLIFGRFNQIDASLSRKYGGTGIGLSLAKEISELHGGMISVKSEPGKGSTFTLTIPFGKPDENEITEDEKVIEKNINDIQETNPYLWGSLDYNLSKESIDKIKIDNNKSKSILVVEDNLDMLNFLVTLLSAEYNIIAASNGREALNKILIDKQNIDLVLTDVMMPEMDGYELIRAIRSNPKFEGLPVIFLTAKAEISKKIEGIQKGAIDYIVKPFNPKELLARVNAQIELKSLRDKLSVANEKLKQIMNDSSILVSDIGHKFYNELWPFAQVIETEKEIIERIEANQVVFDKEFLDFAKDNLSHCNESLERIEQMKDKIKRNFGKQTEKTFNKIDSLIDEVLNNYKNTFSNKNIILEKNYNFKNSQEIKINPDQIKIVIENILNNSIHALEMLDTENEEPKIIIKSDIKDNNFYLIIEDNGPGMSDDVAENIFSMFYGTKKSKAKKGLGIGLYISKWIIKDCHRGKIEVESENGLYTRFNIVLPVDGDKV